jgi:adenylyltransferase/sulfurtransferase
MKEISVAELKTKIDNKEDFKLIDVREEHEYEICNIGGELIPMATVPERLSEIPKDKTVVVHCRSGARSANVCLFLESQGYNNVYNLKGGILAWANEIDPSMPKY